ncbi:phosphatidylserine/phosphatidylglycerophosphate/cardiolipin synthase-like enzyme [Altererythrobacter atlanticus]|uniref:Phospholipase D n=1 Tax=Croceibacterium atlanticum TaxID=1267766 RepID=A0A0F7KQE0_9SPHN|nr:phospholipase D-like domain-containing protein [Croceibacterium atlanticum]AKH41769.1 Cardiolipin synthase [Croceibacterium atlanticum]MBB5733234.1 phosphatidylserine/phosphatidylglycerophosphate/cardiolipin synthase-like enzyme [Croceibacterium atlanticum]
MGQDKKPVEGFDDASAEPGIWRYAMADRASVIVDAEDYFALMQEAMLKARRRVLLIGWDFDTRIHLRKGRRWWQRGWRDQYPSRLGSFFVWLTRHNRQLEIRILKWGFGFLKFLTRGTMLLDIARWALHGRIDFKFDSVHPLACCHHQKIVIVDDRLAVCGGIDMTGARWDTRQHSAQDPRRRGPDGHEHGPWHDMTMMMEGDIARSLDALGRARWVRAGGKPLKPVPEMPGSAWPEELVPQFENVEIGIARTRAQYNGWPEVNEILQLFLQQIARAKRFIYIENQYFASREIAEAISRRLQEDDPPEIVLVHPLSASGWVESQTMDPIRTRLVQAMKDVDSKNRFHIYCPYSGDVPVYVHAKLMIVDDEIVRIGSANFNNRSMGLDSECDVFIDAKRPANGHCGEVIRNLRYSLLAEHCGLAPAEVGPLLEKAGSMAAMIAALGDSRDHRLVPYQPEELGELERELVDRETFDPEEPPELFEIIPRRRGLFRQGSLLGRAVAKLDSIERKRKTRKNEQLGRSG